MNNAYTRDLLVKTFTAGSQMGGDSVGTMTLTGAAAAGLLLSLFGTARAALSALESLPMTGPWPRAMRILSELATIERADTLPPIAETGT